MRSSSFSLPDLLSTPFGRRGALLGLGALLLGLAAPRTTSAQGLIALPDLGQPGSGEGPGRAPSTWLADRRVYIQDRSTERGKSYRIVGDVVELTDESFPSLARPDAAIISGKTALVIEARELRLDMALRLDDAELIVLADRVIVGPNGVLSFAEPAGGYAQKVDIRARTFSLEGAGQVPLRFRLARDARDVRISAAAFVDRKGSETSEQAAAFALIKSASLDRRSDGLANESAGHPAVIVDGEAADYGRQLAGSVWPEASVLKLQRFFATDPYDPAVCGFVVATIGALTPALEAQSSGVAEAMASGLADAVARGTDGFGLRAYDVPMTALETRIERFRRRVEDEFGVDGNAGMAAAWDALAVAASRSGAIDMETFRALSGELAALEAELEAIRADAAEIDSELDLIEADVTSLNEKLQNQEHFVKQQIEAQQFENPNSGVADGFKVIAAVGSVCFPAAAPFLIVASGVVSAVDAANRNDGDLLAQAKSIGDVITLHAAIAQQSSALRSGLDGVLGNFDAAKKYVTAKESMTPAEAEAFGKWKAALGGMRTGAGELYKLLKATPPSAEVIFDDDLIRNDPEMVRLMTARNARVEDQSRALGRFAEALERTNVVSEGILKKAAVLAELQRLTLTNDPDNVRIRQLADAVRTEAVRDLARQAALLRRAVLYGTGSDLDLPPGILYFPEGDAAEASSAIMDPAQPDIYADMLRLKRLERWAAYGSILGRASSAYEEAIDANGWNVRVPISFTAHAHPTSGTEEARDLQRRFIQDLNRLIGDAIRTGASSARLPVPFAPSVIATTENAVLAGISVSGLTFAAGREPEGDVNLLVEHPRYGTLYRNGVGQVFSAAPPPDPASGDLEPWQWPVRLPGDVTTDWRENLFIAGESWGVDQFVLPFFAPYSVFVEVPNPGNFSSAPKVESITIDFAVMRPV